MNSWKLWKVLKSITCASESLAPARAPGGHVSISPGFGFHIPDALPHTFGILSLLWAHCVILCSNMFKLHHIAAFVWHHVTCRSCSVRNPTDSWFDRPHFTQIASGARGLDVQVQQIYWYPKNDFTSFWFGDGHIGLAVWPLGADSCWSVLWILLLTDFFTGQIRGLVQALTLSNRKEHHFQPRSKQQGRSIPGSKHTRCSYKRNQG